MTLPVGTVSLTLSIEVPLEAIVQHWTRDEAAALLAGDSKAVDELVTEAANRRDLWSGFDVEHHKIAVTGTVKR
jgi:hypothetical protein